MAAQNLNFLDPELQQEQTGIDRRRRLAEALQADSLKPLQGQMVGKYYVGASPVQGLAKLFQAYASSEALKEADKGAADVGRRAIDKRSQTLARALGAAQGTPGVEAVPGGLSEMGDEISQGTPGQAAVPGNPMAAMNMLAGSGFQDLAQMGTQGMLGQIMPRRPEPFTLNPGAQRYDENNRLIATAPNRPPVERSFKVGDTRQMRTGRNIVTQEYQPDGSWKEIARGDVDRPPSVNVAAPVTPVTIQDPNDPSKTIVVDGRTGRLIGSGPKMTEAGKIDATAMKAMSGLGADLQAAEDLLTGVVRTADGQVVKGNLPTGSGIGSLVDKVAGFVGASPAGAAEADSLKVVAARLIGKVPRFEGPQSDKDVNLYKQAAADAGNESLPRERRLAAVRTMREIYRGYETGERGRILGGRRNDDVPPGTPPARRATDIPDAPPPGAVRERR